MYMSKEEYIKKFLELYDNTNWIYEGMLPELNVLKKENTEEYTKQMLLVKEGYYSNENMRKKFEQKLIKEDALIIRDLYDEAIEYEHWLKLQPWLHKKLKIITYHDDDINRKVYKKS